MLDRRRTATAVSATALALTTAGLLSACSGAADAQGTGSSSSSSTASDSSATGTWVESGEYQTPGGTESVQVTLTAKDGTVTAVTVKGSGGSPNSQRYQSAFISGISGEVVGKSLADLSVGAVSGSSLTGQGFNAAVEKIRADAASS